MKLNRLLFTVSTLLLLTPFASAQSTGETLFDTKCASCHIKVRPTDFSKLIAPPVMGVVRHVKMAHPTKEEAVKFMVEYALNPQPSKAVCLPERIKAFGLMPSQKGNVTPAELKTIAEWMYDNFGQGMGRGMGNGKSCNSCATKDK